MRHTIVYGAPDEFCGWPANHGIWQWHDEVLLGFLRGAYREDAERHSIAPERPQRVVFARSLDAGDSWRVEESDTLVDEGGHAAPCPGGIHFADPDFVLRCNYADFQVSSDRGHTWRGPYHLPDAGRELKARTDYVIDDEGSCALFLAAYEPSGGQDRAFCARTVDGGRTFAFVSWMTGDPLSYRSVMPSTVRCPDGSLVSALRRRVNLDGHMHLSKGTHRCWIDVVRSGDGGCSWHFLSRVGNTGARNGNPPALALLADGRLCVAYGYRGGPYGIRARISGDGGRSWGEEIVLRDDGRTWDLGYPRLVQRPDGQLLAVYYFTTDARPEQHIAATVWRPVPAHSQ